MRAIRLASVAFPIVAMVALAACQLILPFHEGTGEGTDAGPAGDAPIDAAGADAGDATSDAHPGADADAARVPDGSSGADACTPGSCQPVPLASDQSNPVSLRVFGGQVYWVTYDGSANAGVWHVPVTGGAAQMLVSDAWLSGLTVGSNGVYWSDPAGVATYDGGVVTYVGMTNVQALTEDDASVYWSDWGNGKHIYAEPFGAPAAGPPTPLYTNTGTAFGLAYYQGNLYWTVNDTDPTQGLVMFGSTDGGTATNIAQMQANPLGISVDATGVYWANSGANGGDAGTLDQAVYEKPSDGSPAYPLATNLSHPVAVWADPGGAYVYWVEQGSPPDYADGRVVRASKTGTPNPTVLATGQARPNDIAGDDAAIYWANGGIADDAGASTTGQIMKCPK